MLDNTQLGQVRPDTSRQGEITLLGRGNEMTTPVRHLKVGTKPLSVKLSVLHLTAGGSSDVDVCF